MIAISNNEGACGIAATAMALGRNAAALDAIEAGIRLVEASEEVRTVGRGGWPNLLGEVELDASVMDGTTLRTGAIGSLIGYLHPVSIARQVLERLPHELLVGEGARRFATEIGAEAGELLMPHARDAWERWFRDEVGEADRARWPDVPMAELCKQAIDPEIGRDTTVFLARDAQGHIGAGTSTSGWGWKYPGRLGDSPIIGAGSYADSRYGACACTGVGEMSIRAGTSRAVVLYMKMGMSVEEAVLEAVDDMRALKGGLIGRVTIHAIDAADGHKVIAVNGLPENHYWLWRAGEAAPSSQPCEIVTISEDAAPKPTAHLRYERMAL
ncbi:Asparaginase [Bosea sp. 62]|uniref:N(4)-(beta-N-acetylglucosaminyl)-L-asparaginase n=1 Tax=unclassified Bosea (in: a-proteobacteria) TaxID=2653178 RepID=UPI001256DCDE|nr:MULTISPECIES: N(4)-(beta-N-acetylglucosaminyl)-L-asparaginase [unclassified Bosea (in: a-proteobacteria)]CAD5292768.1 Asparaginase [Bosea sp. 21B]CAD5293378.1 Asparaginase [Bosea sp. 46]CAD5299674.1 Asparaginase [Bosea sp. 7B]VVT62241.1 Asparaginase [Bosea sp. EC-HK365B]VXB08229.1 Asparaginase [Bosea sp. 125]